MDVNYIVSLFNSVTESGHKNITVLYDNKNYIIGKHNDGICFVIRSKGGQKKKYKNGDMSISLNTKYLLGGNIDNYSAIFFRNSEEKKVLIFLETMINCVKDKDIDSEKLFEIYSDISDVFKSIPFDYSSFIGKFGELLFIKYVYDSCGINLVTHYQSTANHLVDFKYNDFNFEVKTTSSKERIHHINNDQLRGNGYLCSIKIVEDNSGQSFMAIFEKITELFNKNPIRLSYMENYILTVPQNYLDEKYNISYENIKMYKFSSIPRFENYHECISDIKFVINLTNFVSFDVWEILDGINT